MLSKIVPLHSVEPSARAVVDSVTRLVRRAPALAAMILLWSFCWPLTTRADEQDAGPGPQGERLALPALPTAQFVEDDWPFLKPREGLTPPEPQEVEASLADPNAINYLKYIEGRDDREPGFVGRRRPRPPDLAGGDMFPIEDRWRIGFPIWDRYAYGSPLNPYFQNVLKGDYPVKGQNIFFQFTAVNNTFLEHREVAVARAHDRQDVAKNDLFLTGDLFQWENSFHPADWFIRVTAAFDITRVSSGGTDEDAAIQEGFYDKLLAIVSPYYDQINLRIGRQAFNFDFRGFLFVDTNDAVRLFGNYEANRLQWNLIAFKLVEKDPVSLFNTFDDREHQVYAANVIYQDWPFLGFNSLAGVLYDVDRIKNHTDTVYLELAGDQRIGRFNITAAFIQAFGRDERNPISGLHEEINGQFAALELAYQIDWILPKIGILWASGDADPTDGKARGFDSPFEVPAFAGAGFSYYQREAIVPGGVQLSNQFAFLPSLRNRAADPVNFVNPGLLLFNVGFDAVLSTRWQAQFNLNSFRINHPDAVNVRANQVARNQVFAVGKELGQEFNVGLFYRPLIIDNIICTFGSSVLYPGSTIRDLNGGIGEPLYTFFGALTLTY